MIGKKLLELRKSKNLSQEEVAGILNVTRQTVSKWETDQSVPDFDKIVPLCELYKITADELLTGEKHEITNPLENEDQIKRKKAKGISQGILLYFVGIVWIMIAIPVINMNPIVASAIFLLILGVATYLIVYTCMIHKKEKPKKEEEPKVLKQINLIINLITLIIYLLISFITMAWHITWILWIVASLIEEIVKLIFVLKGDLNEK